MGLFSKKKHIPISQPQADAARRALAALNADEEANKNTPGRPQSPQDRAGFQRQRNMILDQIDWAEERGKYAP